MYGFNSLRSIRRIGRAFPPPKRSMRVGVYSRVRPLPML